MWEFEVHCNLLLGACGLMSSGNGLQLKWQLDVQHTLVAMAATSEEEVGGGLR